MKNMDRVVVVGSSCSGKSTFSKKLSKKLKIEYIELDTLHWKPNWQERETEEFRKMVDIATQGESWVVDGNYSVARDVFWPKATTIIWLNYSFPLVLYRSITRSINRAYTKQELFSGNVETFKQSFFSKESVVLWVLKTFHSKRKRYRKLLSLENLDEAMKVYEFTSTAQTEAFLRKEQAN